MIMCHYLKRNKEKTSEINNILSSKGAPTPDILRWVEHIVHKSTSVKELLAPELSFTSLKYIKSRNYIVVSWNHLSSLLKKV